MAENMVSIKISREAYKELEVAKELAIKQAQESGATELAQALVAMGLGAFAGWLIFRAIKSLEREAQRSVTR
ncbi:MAG: hypothetical protein AB1485_00190 [Candidatus Thermoplasmatota archaeon]